MNPIKCAFDNYVPLSEFIGPEDNRDSKRAGSDGEETRVAEVDKVEKSAKVAEVIVHPRILEAIYRTGGTVMAAYLIQEQVHTTEVQAVDFQQGLVRFAQKPGCQYTIVSESLRHDFPVITNWNASLNDGRGGPQVGATDGIGVLRLHPETGEREIEINLRDENEASPYYYCSDAYALFSGERDGLHERTPAYERYIGEMYSVFSVTNEAVLKLSDEVLRLTGFPVVIRHPDTAPKQLENIPAFQLIHGCVTAGSSHGDNRSMVSYILPPFWTALPEVRYPAVLCGFYDQNENVFSTVGPPLLKILGEALNETGKGAVGIIWNGGGSFGTRTLQGTVHAHLDDLFRTAIEKFAVDSTAIVTVGGSRGGITSLIAAGNPNNDVYKVRYAVCYNVPFGFGAPFKEMLNPTCPVCWCAVCEDTGYKDAWKPGWKDEQGRNAVELFLHTLLGTSDDELIASECGPASDAIIQALRNNGTQIWLAHGTHDAYTSSWLSFEWVDRARRSGINIRHEIGYRFGHNNCTNPFDSARECLVSLLTGTELLMEGTRHYRRASEDPQAWEIAERMACTHQPVFFEGPKIAVKGLPVLLILYGEPGMEYKLSLHSVSDEGRGAPIVLLEGTMQTLAGYREGFSYVKDVRVIEEWFDAGSYTYQLEFRRRRMPNAEMAGEEAGFAAYCPQPGFIGQPTLEIVEQLPNFTSPGWLENTTKHVIGWGLSEV